MVSDLLLDNLTLDSTLADLDSFDFTIDWNTPGTVVYDLFNRDNQIPGVLVMAKAKLIRVISRDRFFHKLGQMYGIELFLKHPIYKMLEGEEDQPLVLSSDCKISRAVNEALKRDAHAVYEPVVILQPDGDYRLTSILSLFVAQNQILIMLHNQRLFTVTSGLNMSDEEALDRLVRYAGLPQKINRWLLTTQYSVRCDHCGESLRFTLADVVRCHPQLNRGIEITDRMGSRFYLVYLRHQCCSEVWEVPVQLDEDFAYRNARPARFVDTYV